VPKKYDGQIASTGFSVLRPAPGIDPAFLFYKTISSDFVNTLSVKQYGVSYPAVKSEQVRAQPLALPPANEQRRIVAKIEELFSELDKAIENLKAAREQLKAYRQSVLKHAFQGKLTAQWREKNKDKLETIEQLLNLIKKEREARYQHQIEEWKTLVKAWETKGKPGRKPARPRPLRPLLDFTKSEAINKKKASGDWIWLRVGAIFDVISGATPKDLNKAKRGDIPFYKVSDMNAPGNETKMNVSAIYLSESIKNELRLRVYPTGTVIFPKRGGAILTNKKRILSRPSCFDLNTMGVVNSLPSISNDYLWHWFQALDLTEIYDGSNVPQINNKNVEPLLFPICSLEEQKNLSEILSKQMSVIIENEQKIEDDLIKAEALRQSILKKAFSGQLVEQDPNDEPASALLERIRAEKAEIGREKNRKDFA